MWQVIFYQTPQGNSPVYDFIEGLETQTRAKVDRQLHHLQEYGATLAVPNMKALGQGLYELRVRGKREVRVFYCFRSGKNVYVLHGFIKKTQKTPKKELAIARKRQNEV
jgi:phage-related protein